MKSLTRLYYTLVSAIVLSVLVTSVQAKNRKQSEDEIQAFVEAIVSKKSVHVTDTMRITYRLYTEQSINKVLDADFPHLNQYFRTTLLRNTPQHDDVTINGVLYKVIDLYTVILQPRGIGLRKLDEATVLLQYAEPTGQRVRDFFGNEYEEIRYEKRLLKIKPITIEVHDMISI